MNAIVSTVATVPATTDAIDLTALHEATRETLPAKPLSPAVRHAWTRLPELYGTVRLPEPGAPWTDAETVNAHEAMQAAKDLIRAAETLVAAAREGALRTLDYQAEALAEQDPAFAAQLAKAPRDKDGHYILGEAGRAARLAVPGSDTAVFSAEYTVGKPQISIEGLQKLLDSHTITGREYRRLTCKVRAVDTDAVTRETSRNIGLRERLRGAFKRSTPRISVHLREVDPTAAI